jgi:hypothetical protein
MDPEQPQRELDNEEEKSRPLSKEGISSSLSAIFDKRNLRFCRQQRWPFGAVYLAADFGSETTSKQLGHSAKETGRSEAGTPAAQARVSGGPLPRKSSRHNRDFQAATAPQAEDHLANKMSEQPSAAMSDHKQDEHEDGEEATEAADRSTAAMVDIDATEDVPAARVSFTLKPLSRRSSRVDRSARDEEKKEESKQEEEHASSSAAAGEEARFCNAPAAAVTTSRRNRRTTIRIRRCRRSHPPMQLLRLLRVHPRRRRRASARFPAICMVIPSV